MIKSTTTTIKFANQVKKKTLNDLRKEYRNVVSTFVNLIWNLDKIPTLLPKEITSKIDTWLSARMLQCAGKQASGIVRGTKKKQEKRKWMIDKLNKERKHKKARKLQKIYDKITTSKPEIGSVDLELDSRFVKVDLDNDTVFDGWLTLSSIGNKLKIKIPFKKNKHFNKMQSKGKIKSGVRIGKNDITFMFDLPDKPKKNSGKILGIDIGQKDSISCSNGFVASKNKHNHDLISITSILSRKKKGSKGFKRCQEHRKNYINWSINQLNLNGVKQVNRENIKDLRRGKRYSRRLSHWTYTEIFDKLDSYCEEQGVLVQTVNPTYTSQRCSKCGWTHKINRKGKLFKCTSCSFECDADLNASLNISLPLLRISKKQRLKQENRKGFYWNAEGQEPIVPVVKKTN